MFQTLHVHVITEVLYNCKLLPVHRVLCRNYKYYKIDCITEKYCIRFYVQIIVGKVIKSVGVSPFNMLARYLVDQLIYTKIKSI